MELKEALVQRKSIRGYLKRSVPQETVREVLCLASRSISSVNCQPWEFVVLTGETLKKVSTDNAVCFREKLPTDIPDIYGLEGAYRKRQVEIGKALLQSMGIAREDKERRAWWTERGFRFFDAPVGILLCIDTSLDQTLFRTEIGCIAQSITLAAMEFGLSTCVANQPAMYQRGMHQYAGVAENKKALLGIALGYEDESFAANHVISTREDIDAITLWRGFT